MEQSALAGVGSCLQEGPALSDIDQFVRIAQIKRLNSNCVLVLMFHHTVTDTLSFMFMISTLLPLQAVKAVSGIFSMHSSHPFCWYFCNELILIMLLFTRNRSLRRCFFAIEIREVCG